MIAGYEAYVARLRSPRAIALLSLTLYRLYCQGELLIMAARVWPLVVLYKQTYSHTHFP